MLRHCNRRSTHWSPDKMDTISQTTFPNAFSWVKMCECRLKFHWSKFVPKGQINNIPSLNQIVVAVQATSHYLNQWWLVYWRIYASLGLNLIEHAHTCEIDETNQIKVVADAIYISHNVVGFIEIIYDLDSDNNLLKKRYMPMVWKLE